MRVLGMMGVLFLISGPVLAAGTQEGTGQTGQQGQVGEEGAALSEREEQSVVELYQFARHMEALAKLADEKGGRGVERVSKEMKDDYGNFVDDLEDWADENGISLEEAKTEFHPRELGELKDLSGRAFDQRYLEIVRRESSMAMDQIDQVIGTTRNPDFKDEMERASQIISRHAENLPQGGQGQGGQKQGRQNQPGQGRSGNSGWGQEYGED